MIDCQIPEIQISSLIDRPGPWDSLKHEGCSALSLLTLPGRSKGRQIEIEYRRIKWSLNPAGWILSLSVCWYLQDHCQRGWNLFEVTEYFEQIPPLPAIQDQMTWKKSFQINTSRFHDSNFIQLKRERWDLTKSSGIQQNTLPISLQQNMEKSRSCRGVKSGISMTPFSVYCIQDALGFDALQRGAGFWVFRTRITPEMRHEVRRNPCSWEKQTPRHNKHLQMDLC